MKNILIISVLLSILLLLLVVGCNPDEQPKPTPPVKLDCDMLMPVHESVIADYEPTFEWCADESVDSFYFQLSDEEDFSTLLFDNFTETNNITPLYWIPIPSSPGSIENHTLPWGTKYYWRVAAIKDSVQQDWSDTYIFETNDIRDDVVGIYEAKKRKIRLSHNGNPIYYDSVYSIHQIEVEKILNSRGVRVKDITAGDFDIEMSRVIRLNWWMIEFGEYSHTKFKMDIDSFEIRDIPCGSLPCTGFRYSGRE